MKLRKNMHKWVFQSHQNSPKNERYLKTLKNLRGRVFPTLHEKSCYYLLIYNIYIIKIYRTESCARVTYKMFYVRRIDVVFWNTNQNIKGCMVYCQRFVGIRNTIFTISCRKGLDRKGLDKGQLETADLVLCCVCSIEIYKLKYKNLVYCRI